jgi:hypothetical protein
VQALMKIAALGSRESPRRHLNAETTWIFAIMPPSSCSRAWQWKTNSSRWAKGMHDAIDLARRRSSALRSQRSNHLDSSWPMPHLVTYIQTGALTNRLPRQSGFPIGDVAGKCSGRQLSSWNRHGRALWLVFPISAAARAAQLQRLQLPELRLISRTR